MFSRPVGCSNLLENDDLKDHLGNVRVVLGDSCRGIYYNYLSIMIQFKAKLTKR